MRWIVLLIAMGISRASGASPVHLTVASPRYDDVAAQLKSDIAQRIRALQIPVSISMEDQCESRCFQLNITLYSLESPALSDQVFFAAEVIFRPGKLLTDALPVASPLRAYTHGLHIHQGGRLWAFSKGDWGAVVSKLVAWFDGEYGDSYRKLTVKP
jgi:hypothetical protein